MKFSEREDVQMFISSKIIEIVSEVRALIGRMMSFFLSGDSADDLYLNGSDLLPPPLSPEEENDAIARLATDPSVRSLLIEHNLRLVVYIAKKFENTGIGI